MKSGMNNTSIRVPKGICLRLVIVAFQRFYVNTLYTKCIGSGLAFEEYFNSCCTTSVISRPDCYGCEAAFMQLLFVYIMIDV